MEEWWAGISNFEKFFWILAVPSSALFIVQMILIVIGIGDNGDIPDIDGDLDMDLEPDVPLRLVTLRNAIIFFTIFSWSGIMGLRKDYSKVFTIGLGLILGLVVIAILLFIERGILKLTESGNMNLNYAIGVVGDVYLTIPSGGERWGKVQVNFQSSIKELDAITYGEELPTGTKIIVTKVENGLLVVERLNKT